MRPLPFPPPYRAAIAINNDTDGMSVESFLDFHEFVNGAGETPYGEGLGLEVGDSLWVWSEHGQLSLVHGLPESGLSDPSPEAPLLAELGRAGWLDTLHGFGAWSTPVELTRDQARAALEHMRKLEVAPVAYTNHGGRGRHDGGGGTHMAHNIGGPWGWYQHGDDPDHQSYCLDLLNEAGFRYYWTDNAYELTKFGEHLTYTSDADLNAAFASHDQARYLRRRDAVDAAKVYPAFPDADEATLAELRQRMFNSVLYELPAADGSKIWGYKRYRGPEGPTAGNFALQVSADNVDRLIALGGAVVVYTHFGVWRAVGRPKDHPSMRRSVPPVLDEHAAWAWRTLAGRQADGDLWITTTGRLLDFLRVRDHVEVKTRSDGDTLVIELAAIDDPVTGREPMSPALAGGLAFALDPGQGTVVIECDGQQLETERHPAAEDDGGDIVAVPWRRLEWPTDLPPSQA